jgi:hypothetical protein
LIPLKTDNMRKLKLNYYDPVLLYQGFGIENVLPSSQQTFQYTFEKNRGHVKAIDIINPYPEDPTLDNPFTFTCLINGQVILKDMNWANFAYYKTSGRDNEELVRVVVNERGLAELRVDNTLVGTPAQARLELAAYYTNEQHDEFLRAFRWRNGLGLKQQSYRMTVPAGTAVGDIITLRDTLPINNGDIVGVSITSVNQDPLLVSNRRFNVAENGVRIIENYNGALGLPSSGRRDWIFKKLIEPASTFTFQCELDTIANFDEYYLITFYFNN